MSAPSQSAKLDSYRDPEIARDYDRRWSSTAGRRRDLRKAKLLNSALERFTNAKTILDVPCGTARFAGSLDDKYDWVGADLSVEMLRQGARKHPIAQMLAADLSALPFEDDAFDVVVCIRLFHLIPEPGLREVFLRELKRVARLGVICGWHHDQSFKIWGRRLRHKYKLRNRPPSNPSPKTVRQEMNAAGFKDLHWLPLRKIAFTSEKVLISAKVD